MKLTYFYATIEVVPRDSYSESLQCSTDSDNKNKLKFIFPYGDITPEQAAAIAEFTKTLTAAYNKLQKQIDNVNQELKLEQYAPIVPPVVETAGSNFDLDVNSAVAQSSHGVSKSESVAEQVGVDYEEAAEVLKETVKEALEEALEERETKSDMA